MNREILFRGKRIDTGEWLEGSLFFDPDLGGAQIMGFEYSTSETVIERGEVIEPVDPSTVGQYTGLTDKNGKKIFEGDVLKAVDGFENSLIGSVEYFSGGFFIKDRPYDYWWMVPNENGYAVEVIGNIHDNPELLEG